jgi:hypothetical protein
METWKTPPLCPHFLNSILSGKLNTEFTPGISLIVVHSEGALMKRKSVKLLEKTSGTECVSWNPIDLLISLGGITMRGFMI